MADAFGEALIGYLNNDTIYYTIRRDDGYVEKRKIRLYFSNADEWGDYQRNILTCAYGRVLDLGAGAGRHTLYLQGKGLEVHAIDISPGAIEVMKKRGVNNVYLMDLDNLNFPDNYFDSILMMSSNFGLAGNIAGTKELLKVLYRISTRKGRIITAIRDPYQTDNPEHLAYHERNKKAGKPAGQIKIRLEYKRVVGDWFDLLMVSSKELKELIRDSGWITFNEFDGKDGHYAVALEKS